MKIKELARISIIKSNDYWPFSVLNKMAYYSAVKIFSNHCKKFSEIKSAYIKHSFADGRYVPGLSDIDWTVIIVDSLDKRDELVFLESFWKRYRLIKIFFPMLGEGEIVSQEELKQIFRCGFKIHEKQKWNLIFGEDCIKCIKKNNNDFLDRIYHALDFYYCHLTNKFFSQGKVSKLFFYEIERITQKIMRYITGDNDSCQRFDNIFDYFSYAILELNKVSLLSYIDLCGYNDEKFPVLINNKIREDLFYAQPQEALIYINNFKNKEAIDDLFIIEYRGQRVCILLKENLPLKTLSDFLYGLRDFVLKHQLPPPYVVTQNIFKNSIEVYNPFLYYGMSRGILNDTDLRKRINEPGKNSLINYSVKNINYLMAIIRSMPEVGSSYSEWVCNDFVEYYLEESIVLKLFLEKGIVINSREHLFKEWQYSYPELLHKFRESAMRDEVDIKHLSEKRFCFAKDIIKNINNIYDS